MFALLSPSQAYFLRENLKLRLLSARHALLARDGASFNADIDASLDWISRYYDNKSTPTVAMLEALHQLRGKRSRHRIASYFRQSGCRAQLPSCP